MFEQFKKFLLEYDLLRIQEEVRNLDWSKVLSNPVVWFVSVPLLGYMIWKRKFRMILLFASMLVFTLMLPHMMPGAGEAIPFPKLILFLGGTLALVLINLYFAFVRRD
ncbi:MAG TPA: hypothetical protein DCE18_11205 [Syntrophobacteraceae bacterium]|nr:hypothetical protein [Syntrophobacteraceae bacterium]HBZ56328.1 hypothetical protein [Syntrophobacteraceae bacterium]